MSEVLAYLVGIVVMPFATLFGDFWLVALIAAGLLLVFLWLWCRFCGMTSRYEEEIHRQFRETQRRDK